MALKEYKYGDDGKSGVDPATASWNMQICEK
jgi:hypothetical protein